MAVCVYVESDRRLCVCGLMLVLACKCVCTVYMNVRVHIILVASFPGHSQILTISCLKLAVAWERGYYLYMAIS